MELSGIHVDLYCNIHVLISTYFQQWGRNPIYGLYRYVPWDRVWFLRFSVLK